MYARILVPIDIEHESSWGHVLPATAELARTFSAALEVVYVVPRYESALVGGFFPADHEAKVIAASKVRLAEIVAGLGLEGVEPRLHVAHGASIYDEVLRIADALDVDLIVVEAQGPDHDDGLGPNAARVARHAKQSTLVIRR